jgi:hypothetical protein
MRKVLFIVAAMAVLVMGLSLPGEARTHFRGNIWIGPGWYPYSYPYTYSYPYYYAPPPVIIQQQAPDVYVKPEPQPEEPVWYYCPDEKAYYPYVKHCPGGWQKVMPTPPPAEQDEGKE